MKALCFVTPVVRIYVEKCLP